MWTKPSYTALRWGFDVPGSCPTGCAGRGARGAPRFPPRPAGA